MASYSAAFGCLLDIMTPIECNLVSERCEATHVVLHNQLQTFYHVTTPHQEGVFVLSFAVSSHTETHT
eukprot:254426-Amphidinium_carterae.1